MFKTLFVGIDISLKTATCCFLNQEDKHHGKPFDVYNNNLTGFEELKQKITTLCQFKKYDLVCIELEATNPQAPVEKLVFLGLCYALK